MNIEHYYEMIDMGVSNPASSVRDCLLSQVKLDPAWFDGAVYYFEVVAYNNTGSAQTLELRSQSSSFGDTQEATVSVSASTTYTRYRSAAFTPATGEHTYNLRLPSATADTIRVSAARIVIVQTAPTKTRLQVPLLSGQYLGYTNLQTSAVYVVQKSSASSAAVGNNNPWFRKDSDALATVLNWTLEVTGCVAAGSGGTVILRQAGTSNAVTGASIAVTATTPTLYSATIADTADNFTSGTDFELAYAGDGTNAFSLQKAALYVTLTDLTKAEVRMRFARVRSGTTANSFGQQRCRVSADNFSGSLSEQWFHEVTGFATDLAHPLDSWGIYSVNSASSTSGSLLTGSVLDTTDVGGTDRERIRSAALTPPTNGYDVYPYHYAVTSRNEGGQMLIVQVKDAPAAPADDWVGLTVARELGA